MDDDSSTRVSSAELQRSFGRYRDVALQQPVSITSHGRETLVLMSAAEYRRLKKLDRRAVRPWQLSKDAIKALLAAEPPAEATKYDRELKSKKSKR